VAYTTARLAAVSWTSDVTSISAPTASSTSATTPAPVATSAPAATTSAVSSTSSGLSMGAKIGLGVGIALGAVLLALVGGVVWWARRKAAAREKEVRNTNSGGVYGSAGEQGAFNQGVVEIDGFTTQRIPKGPMEMPAGEPPGYSR
jgi:predicted lipid-binding transport protein (Tim44 family)